MRLIFNKSPGVTQLALATFVLPGSDVTESGRVLATKSARSVTADSEEQGNHMRSQPDEEAACGQLAWPLKRRLRGAWPGRHHALVPQQRIQIRLAAPEGFERFECRAAATSFQNSLAV